MLKRKILKTTAPLFWLVLLFCLFQAAPALAATCTWTGGSTNWNAATSNWSCSHIPTSSDDVVINTTVTVTIAASTTADFSTLSVGGGAGTSTLTLTGNIGTGGSITIESSGVITQNNTTQQVLSGNMTIKSTGKLNHTNNSTTQAGIVNFSLANLDVQSGGSIDVRGLGYDGASAGGNSGKGTGAGAGGTGSGGGGAHAGNGNTVNGAGGTAYCAIDDVNTMGSGGGSSSSFPSATGGAGGGLVKIDASGDVTISGSIDVRGSTGANGSGASGGAGGGIKIDAARILGTPTLLSAAGAAGGTTTSSGGGGGCIQLLYDTSIDSTVTSAASASGGGSSSSVGGAGTVFVKANASSYGDIYLTNTNSAIADTPIANKTFDNITISNARLRSGGNTINTSTTISNTSSIITVASSDTILSGSWNQSGSTTLSLNGTLVATQISTLPSGMSMIINSGGTFTGSSSLEVQSGATLFVNSGATITNALNPLTSAGTLAFVQGATMSITDLEITGGTTTLNNYSTSNAFSVGTFNQTGGTLQHSDNSTAQTHIINISANNFTLGASGTINVKGRGYDGGAAGGSSGKGPAGGFGVGGTSGGGGAHGGNGGNGAGAGGTAYCTSTNVSTMGAGGGSSSSFPTIAGGAGGGLVIISASGTATIDGTIDARGNTPTSGGPGGGAGGGIKILAENVLSNAATASILASGASGGSVASGGRGGGGCISISYRGTNEIASGDVSVAGGTSGTGTAGAGTFSAQQAGINLSTTAITAAEGGSTGSYTVVLAVAPTADVTVTPACTDTATGCTVSSALTFTTANWSTPQTVTVTAVDDSDYEGTHSATITNTASSSDVTYNGLSISNVTATITDNDIAAPPPNLAVSDLSVDEGDGIATVTVTMTGTSASTVTVDYATANNTASASSDYIAKTGTLTWTAGQSGDKTFTVSITNDSANEASESFYVNLSNASNANITRSQGEVTITDNDATPSLSINDPSASEASGSLSYTVTLSAASGQTVTVSYASSNGTASAGSDYTETTGTLTFNPGETSKNIAVTLSDNSLDATDKTLVMTLSNASNATISDATGTGTITDDEATPSLAISDISSDEADGTVIITVTMTGSSASTVTVDYATANNSALAPSDYTAKSGTLTWSSGQTGDQSFAVDLSDDSLDENGESFFVNLSNASNATISDSQATVSISDNDDPPLVSIDDVSVSEADGTATFTVSLSSPSGLAVGVEYSTSNGTASAGVDYDATSGTLSFNPGETSQAIEVTILDNSVDETSRSFNVALSNASNATIGTGVGVGTINDDEQTPSASWSSSSQNILEGDISVVVQANLSGASSQDVTLPFSLSGSATPSSDYSVGVSSITIPAGQTSGSFSIILADDSAQESSETIVVTMGTPTNASAGNPSAQTITISDNDSAGITVSKNSVTIAEGSDTATYTVQLNAQPSAEVVVHISSDNASTGCQTDKSSLTFSTSNWSSAQTVTISAVDDGLYEGSSGGACNITQTASSSDNAYNGIGVGSISVSIAENDSEPSIAFSTDAQSASEGGSTLTVTAQLSAVSGVDTTLPLNFAGSATDGVDYSASGSSISIPAGQSSGSISITPIEDETSEGAETILVSMGSPTNAVAGSPSTQTITLADNDASALQIGESGGNTAVTEGALTDTFTVKLASKPTQNVTVTITPDAQCQADQSTLLFTDSDWDSNQTVTLSAVDDEVAEGNHSCEVSITAASDDSMYAGLSDSLSLTVNDDDSAGISITQSGGSISVSEGSGSDGIEIVLTSQPTADVTVTLSAGSQLHLSTSSLTFSAQNWQDAQSVEVTAEDDSIAEGNHQGSIGLSFVSSDPNYQNFSASPISVDILDNDSAGYTLVASNAHPQVSTSGSVYTYTLALNSQPTGNVHIAIQPGSSLQASPSSLDFTTSDWATSKTVTIAYLTGDAQNGTVSHSMTSTDPAYDHLPVESITVEIIHDNPDDGDSGDGGDGGNGDPGDGGGGGSDGGNESGGGGGSSGFSVHDRTLVAGGSLRLGGESTSGSFSWQILSGPGSLDNPHSSNPVFSAGEGGSSVIQMTFTNAQGEISSQTFTIHAVDSQSVGYEVLASNLVLVMPGSGDRIIEGTTEGHMYLQGADWSLFLPAGVSNYELSYSSDGRLLLSFGGSVFISSSTEENLSGEIDLRSEESRQSQQQFSEVEREDFPEDFASIFDSSDWGDNQSSEYLIGGGNRLYFFDSQLNALGEITGDAEHPIAGAGMDGQFIAAGPASHGFDEMLEYSGENPNNTSNADILYLFDISELENGFDRSLEDADIRIQLGEGAYIQSYALGDLDGDGHSDCAVAGSDGNTYIFLHLSLHEGETLQASSANSVIQGGSGSLFIEDVSGDDLQDLIIGLPEAQGGMGEIVIFFGGNAWESTLEIASAQALHILGREADGKIGTDFISADMDGDGVTDLITVNAFNQRILIDIGDGMQAAPPNYLEGGCSLQKEPSRPPVIPFTLILSWITVYGFARRRINPKSS